MNGWVNSSTLLVTAIQIRGAVKITLKWNSFLFMLNIYVILHHKEISFSVLVYNITQGDVGISLFYDSL